MCMLSMHVAEMLELRHCSSFVFQSNQPDKLINIRSEDIISKSNIVITMKGKKKKSTPQIRTTSAMSKIKMDLSNGIF